MLLYLLIQKADNRCDSVPATWLRMVTLALMLGCSSYSKAQFLHKLNASNLLLEGRANYGFLISHHLEMQVFMAHFMAFEINLGIETYGKSHWEAMYAYPIIGVSYWYSGLGNSEFVGKANALFPYINFPLTRSAKFAFNLRVGGGLGYLTRHFDRLNNYKYLAIGSHVNAAINLMFELRWKPTPHINLATGIALMHFSNGSLKTPNYGINIPTANLAMAYRLTRLNEHINKEMIPELNKFEFDGHKFIELEMAGSFGVKEVPEYDKQFYVYALSGNVFKAVSYKSKVGVGFDFTYDKSDLYTAEIKQIELKQNIQIIRPSANLGYQLNLSRTSFVFNIGFYLGGKIPPPASAYFKTGMHVMLSRNVFGSLILKSHYARVDFIGLGLGYKLKLLF